MASTISRPVARHTTARTRGSPRSLRCALRDRVAARRGRARRCSQRRSPRRRRALPHRRLDALALRRRRSAGGRRRSSRAPSRIGAFAARRAAIDALASIGGGDAAQAVILLLADEEDVVALAAIRALGRLGRAELLASLAATTKDSLRLATVLRALRVADPERAFAAARPLVRSAEPFIAAAAIEVIGSTEIDGRVEALMAAADHGDHEVVKLALAQLAHVGDEHALLALARAIDHGAEPVRRYAAELLGQEGGHEAESMLRARLDRERSAEVRRAIMEALSVRPPPEPA